LWLFFSWLPSPGRRTSQGTIPKNLNLAPAASDSSSRLPVKRVVLDKNGTGYFEHTARVRGNQDLAIDFTTTQLNDVLKSLSIVDLGKAASLECATTP
jgi:hypothetical protein